jgi:hypothetical protein
MAGTSASGRKPNEINIALIQKLTPLDDIAFDMLKKGIEEGKFPYLKLYFQYKFGRPSEMKEININSNPEQPLFNLVFKSTDEIENQ